MAKNLHADCSCSSKLLIFAVACLVCRGIKASSYQLGLRLEPSKSVQFKATGSSLHLKCIINFFNVTGKNFSLSWTLNNNNVLYEVIHHNKSRIAEVNIDSINHQNAGEYVCVAKDRSSHVVWKKLSVQINVGDPPPKPQNPELKHLFGMPPVNGSMTYFLPPAQLSAYPLTIELWLSHTSDNNPCIDPRNSAFQLVEQRRSSKSMAFEADISPMVKKFFSHQDANCSLISCTNLCATVVISNQFGTKYSSPKLWSIEKRAECGKVEELKVIQRYKTSIAFEWKTPKFMAKSHQSKIWYFIILSGPKLWVKIPIKAQVGKDANYTFKSLRPYTKFTIHVYCSIYDANISSTPATVRVWTKQDAPSKGPYVQKPYWEDQTPKDKGEFEAVIEWEEMKNKSDILQGVLESYIVKIQNLDKPNLQPILKKVKAQYVTLRESLPMANYSFTVSACTGGGCKESSPNTLQALVALESQEKPTGHNKANTEHFTGLEIKIGIPLFVTVFVIFLIAAVWYLHQRGQRHPGENELPRDIDVGDFRTGQEGNQDQTQATSHIYAAAAVDNDAYSESTDDV